MRTKTVKSVEEEILGFLLGDEGENFFKNEKGTDCYKDMSEGRNHKSNQEDLGEDFSLSNQVDSETVVDKGESQDIQKSGECKAGGNDKLEELVPENMQNENSASSPGVADDTARETEPSWEEKYIRLLSEFDNYRRNVQKQSAELRKYEGEGILREILEIVDDLERALSYATGEKIKSDPVLMGVELTLKNFYNTLKRFGVEGVSVLGEQFDPTCMEAIERIEDSTQPDGTVVKEFKKLYRFKDKVLRFAEVGVVSNIDREN